MTEGEAGKSTKRTNIEHKSFKIEIKALNEKLEVEDKNKVATLMEKYQPKN